MLTNLRDAFIDQSRSPNIVPFHMLVSYGAILTLSLRRAVFTIFDFKNVVTLKSGSVGVIGHSRSLKVAPIRYIVYGFLLVFFSNFVPNTHRFWDIWLQICHDLEDRVRGPSRSLEMSPCDRPHTTSYWRSIVTMALSRDVSEIFSVEKCRDLEIRVKDNLRSLKVVPLDRLSMVSY